MRRIRSDPASAPTGTGRAPIRSSARTTGTPARNMLRPNAVQDGVPGLHAGEAERPSPELVRRRHVLLGEGVEGRRAGRARGRRDADDLLDRCTQMLAEGMTELVARAFLQLALVVLAEQDGEPLEVGDGG